MQVCWRLLEGFFELLWFFFEFLLSSFKEISFNKKSKLIELFNGFFKRFITKCYIITCSHNPTSFHSFVISRRYQKNTVMRSFFPRRLSFHWFEMYENWLRYFYLMHVTEKSWFLGLRRKCERVRRTWIYVRTFFVCAFSAYISILACSMRTRIWVFIHKRTSRNNNKHESTLKIHFYLSYRAWQGFEMVISTNYCAISSTLRARMWQ